RAIIYKWRKHGTVENLPRSGRPTKITPRAQRQLIQEVTKDPTTASKELQASLASVKDLEDLLWVNGTMNSAVYQKILKKNIRPSVCDLKRKQTWVLQQDNDPKYTSKSTSEWLKKNKMKTLEWPSQSPDLNPIEMLWHDLKKVVHARKPSNVAELQQFCKDEWAKIPPQRCNSYGKCLIAVVAAKGKGRELADMMERRKVDILCVQETRWKGSKTRSIGAGFKLFYYGVDSKRNGVGVGLKEEFVRNVLEVKRVSDRVMSLKLEIEGVMLNVVSGYAPQVGCELEEKERFWSELDEVMESIPTGERVVI
ncbi:hypothetical protein QTP86_032601, partial [Hemibagrus guttatus]